MKKTRQIPTNVKVYFSHHRDFPSPKGGWTEVRLVKDKEVISVGRAYCSKRDNFNKRIGRDISLGRALKQIEGGKEL